MKKFMVLLSIVLVSSIAISCGDKKAETNGEEKIFFLKLGSIRDDKDPSIFALKEFIKLVEEKTDGTVQIQLFNNSVLGGLPDMLSGMTSGVLDMMHDRITSYGILTGAAKFNVVAAPFLWESYDELEKFMQYESVSPWFEEAAESTGVRAFMVKGETEARQLTANRPVLNVEDFNGLKVRTAEIAVVQKTMQALKAQPIVIPFSDLYIALRQKTADAQENGFLTIKNASLFEVQPYLMRTDYIRDIGAYYISEDIWKQLSERQQTAIKEAAAIAGDLESEYTRESIETTLEFLKEKMTYIEPDLISIRAEIGTEIYEKFDAEGRAWATTAYQTVKEFKTNK